VKKFPQQPTLLGKFNVRVEKLDGCWKWNGAMDIHGYGSLSIDKVIHKAHRISYTLFKGEIPKDLCIDHLCRNRDCVNPEHLEAVTLSENKRRGFSPAAINARKTHCPKGHTYSKSNTKTYLRSYGISRHCLTCNKVRDKNRDRTKQ